MDVLIISKEPASNKRALSETPLQGLVNVILTPRIGGSTEEAQGAYRRGSLQESLWSIRDVSSTVGAIKFSPGFNCRHVQEAARVSSMFMKIALASK